MVSALRNSPRSSLLPYLQGPSAGAALKLSLISAANHHAEKAYPFDLLDDSGPVSRLIEADFVTDAGSSLKRVVLQVQKDRYSLAVDELRPVTNLDVDAAWRQALSSVESGGEGFAGVILSCQLDPEGSLTPLAPLFYCRERRVFFHPVCPACGLPLQLCRDDDLLEKFGLSHYSKSLKRYLHCASCAAEGMPEFYLYEHDHHDQVTVKDRWSLIEEFRHLDAAKNPDGDFPCVGCPEHESCYGASSAVRGRIIPFSFYPFYLLITESPSLNALDFLHLISGAEYDELLKRLDPQRTPGRVAKLQRARDVGIPGKALFQRNDDRYFLELLFLKLSFLRDLLHQLLVRPELRKREVRSERVWVHVPSVSTSLPASWGLRAEVMGEVHPAAAGNGSITGGGPLAELGLFWFQALCQNSNLKQRELFEVLSEWLTQQYGRSPHSGMAAALTPEQIFWHPDRNAVRDEWQDLWHRACEPGYLLLKTSRSNGVQVSCQELIDTMDILRLEVKARMFQAAPLPVQPSDAETVDAPVATVQVAPDSATDHTVQDILSRLMEKKSPGVAVDPAKGLSAEAEDETMETVILSASTARSGHKPTIRVASLDETFIMPSVPEPPSATDKEPPSDELMDTMIAPLRTVSGQSQEQDEIAFLETIIAALPPKLHKHHDPPERKDAQPAQPEPITVPPEEQNLLEETIFVPPSPGRPRQKG